MFLSWFRSEVLVPRRLFFNVFFYGIQLTLFALGWYLQVTNARLAALNELKYSVWVSRGAGLALAFDGGLLLIPMLRNVIRILRPTLTRIFPADANVWFHRQVAYSMAFWAMVHTTAHYVNFFNVERAQIRQETALTIHYAQAGGITGHFMLLIMLLIYTTAHHKIRRQCFEAFWYTHHLAFFFFIALYTHASGCFVRDSVNPDYIGTFPFYSTQHCLGYESWRFIIWPGIVYLFERMIRAYQARRPTSLSKVFIYPSGIMELRIIKPDFNYTSGQWLFVQVPELSKWQWHPFTITSAPEDPYISIHIRQVGDWTHALGERLGYGPSVLATTLTVAIDKFGKGDDHGACCGALVELDAGLVTRRLPKVRIDGPYGAPVVDVFASEFAILVGAGIGVTPFASILKHILYQQKRRNFSSLRKVEFFWICRDPLSFRWFQSLLRDVEAAQVDPNFLRINIYLTQKTEKNNFALSDRVEEYDPLASPHIRTLFGRPNWDSIYSHIREAIELRKYLPDCSARSKTKVATYFCGPHGLSKIIKDATKRHTSQSVVFTFAKEHF